MNKSFFHTLFTDVEDIGGKIMLWTLPDKKSYFYDTIDTAVEASGTFNGHDVYLGVGVAKKAVGGGKRGKSDNILAMPALIADIDVEAEGVVSKKPRFKDREAAMEFVKSIPLQPTIVVWSGGGLHLYFCFKELFEIETAKESVEILKLSKGWNGFLQKEALKRGVSIDSVWDITRVLRVPGTMNHKTTTPRPVEVIEINPDARYNPDDFEDYLCYDKSDYGVVVPSKTFGSLVLSAEAQPPAAKFDALLENNPDFDEAFRRKRKIGDQSASAYDMALANYAAIAGWTPQEICNLLIFSRVKHGDELKLREDYMSNTIAKAMVEREESEVIKVAEEIVLKAKAEQTEEGFKRIEIKEGTEAAKTAIESLQEILKIPVTSFHQYGNSQFATYSIFFSDGATDTFPSVANFYSQKTWINIADARGGEEMRPMKESEWRKVKALIKAVIHIHLDDEYTDNTKTIRWIRAFSGGRVLSASECMGDSDMPFIHDGNIYLTLTPLLNFLRRTKEVQANFTVQQLGAKLNGLGFKVVVTKTPLNSKNKRFRVAPAKDLQILIHD